MDWWPVLTLAVALAADAFAVAVAQGTAARPDWRRALTIGALFGLAQGLMPVLGLALGTLIGHWMRALDHWIALLLLSVLGVLMLREASRRDEGEPTVRMTSWALLAAAVSTSIDAFAAGITLPMFAMPALLACLVIGVVTAVLSSVGVFAGRVAGAALGRGAEYLGGVMLIALGLKIFIEHQFGGLG